jgi:hypothetical protein
MTKFFLIPVFLLFLHSLLIYPQNKIDFHSPQNTKLFADYLFCEKDYLRAYNEYLDFLKVSENDTVEFKAGLSLQNIGSYRQAQDLFNRIPEKSAFFSDAKIEYNRTLFLQRKYLKINSDLSGTDSAAQYFSFIKRLDNLHFLLKDETLPEKQGFISSFPSKERDNINYFYDWKSNPPYKSPWLAGILSAVIPGSGKVYSGNYSDAVFAVVLTGVFGYLAFTNFKADHKFRAWTFTGVSAFFYAGNIYGSAASAQIYNAKITFDFKTRLNDFLEAFNYLSGNYNFCK